MERSQPLPIRGKKQNFDGLGQLVLMEYERKCGSGDFCIGAILNSEKDLLLNLRISLDNTALSCPSWRSYMIWSQISDLASLPASVAISPFFPPASQLAT